MLFEKKVELLRKGKHKGRETKEFLYDVARMAEGEAFEYLVGETTFVGALVDLSMRPMIPRRETEFWVTQALHSIEGSAPYVTARERATPFRALDLYSGSGCVGLAFLFQLPYGHMTFVELDPKLKRQIELSCDRNKFPLERYDVETGDVYGEAAGPFDVIFAVPPYVPSHMKDEVMEELHAEPSLAFFDREGGFYFHKKTLEGARKRLAQGGHLFLEFDITQKAGIEKLLKEYEFFVYSFLSDPYGHDCAVCVKCF